MKRGRVSKAQEEPDLSDGHALIGKVADGQIASELGERSGEGHALVLKPSLEGARAHVKTGRDGGHGRLSIRQLAHHGGSDRLGEPVWIRTHSQCTIKLSTEQRQQPWLRVSLRSIQQLALEQELIAHATKAYRRPKDALVLTDTVGTRVRKAHLDWGEVDPSREASGEHGDREECLYRMARRTRGLPGMTVNEAGHVAVFFEGELDPRVHQTNVPGCAPIVVAQRRTASESEGEEVERVLGPRRQPFGKMKAEVGIGCEPRRRGPEAQFLRMAQVDVRCR